MKYTNGPWVVTPHPESHVDVFGVGELMDDKEMQYALSHTICYQNAEANARLISAAPELLAALEWMVAHDDTNEGDDPVESLGGQTWNEYNAYWLAGLEQARAAIAKAKGETP